ncbi:hypothetical protein [uncultured Bacteroides sp.]|uniref:hypothetical protein n=1 Tax=uncultured Bacteroides sp. TaxID=162156 RepID=UPI00344FCFA2
MNKKFFMTALVLVSLGMTNVMANTSDNEQIEVSSVNKVATTEYYLEIGTQSGSGLFEEIELLDPTRKVLRIKTKRGGRVEIFCHVDNGDSYRLWYTADSWTGEIITEEIKANRFTISTSYNESASSSTIKYETRYYYIRER